jgi:hypothetical protein
VNNLTEPTTINGRPELFRKERLLRFLLGLIITVAGIVTAYHATIYGLKSEIAAKADASVVTSIDNRLIHIEAILTERVATKAELQQVRDELHLQLLTIEAKLQMIP